MDDKLRAALDTLAVTAGDFAAARDSRNPSYDWLTINERAALSNLREALARVDREETRLAAVTKVTA